MATNSAELSSIAASLEQLSSRLGAMGEGAKEERRDDLASELFAVERSLSSAHRRLTRLVERGDDGAP